MCRNYLVPILLAIASSVSHALSLDADDFVAAKHLTCILAMQSLGYLGEEQYADMTKGVLGEYEQDQSDVIYAEALGYFDGLMFGISSRDWDKRISLFLGSSACTDKLNVERGLAL